MKQLCKSARTGLCLILITAALCACAPQTPAHQPPATEAEIPVPTETAETSAPTVPETEPEPEPVAYDTVPLYYQTDYPYI